MTKLALLAFALLVASPRAHAEHGPSASRCDQDPRCYARDLAVTLTSAEHTLVMPRVVDFAPGRVRVYSESRAKLQRIVESWRTHRDWSVITVHGYAGEGARSQEATLALAQRRADKIRGYLVRYGVPAVLVVAVGHVSDARLATAELSIELCPRGQTCARD